MIDFSKLDKESTYLTVQYGEGLISKKIRKYSKIYAKTCRKIPTHVLGIVYEGDGWFIYESHMREYKKLGIPSGVRRLSLKQWKLIEKDTQYQFRAYKLDLDRESLKKYIGEQYGVGDIRSLFIAAILHTNGRQKDRQGLICSEYMALCCQKICENYDLPAWCITPAHFQDYIENVLEVA